MNGIRYALNRVHAGENEMHKMLLRAAEVHHTEHEVHHVARDLAVWSAEHVQHLAEHAERLGINLDGKADSPNRLTERLRATTSQLIGRRPEPGVLLLHDFRNLYLQGSDNSLHWEMLAQIAQAKHERELLALTEECHPQTLRQIRWANTMLKTQSPQILASI
jgi:hypothetical protein